MVVAYHVIFSMYGFWLPNDPRGSWSTFVGAWELRRFGPATKTTARHSLAKRQHNFGLRMAAKEELKYPPVVVNGVQARAIGGGFLNFAQASGLTIWACSILPEHVHLVVARHDFAVEQITNLLKGAATRQLVAEGVHPLAAYPTRTGRCPKVFTRGEWKVFLNDDHDVRRAIAYVQRNPVKEGKPLQRWACVSPWPEHRLACR